MWLPSARCRSGAINQHEAVVAYVVGAEPALKDDLGGSDGGRGGSEEMAVDVSDDKNITHHIVRQLGNALHKEPYQFSQGFRVNGTP